MLKKKKLGTKNICKQLKRSQNIFNMLLCIENGNINIQFIFHVFTGFFLRVISKAKIEN